MSRFKDRFDVIIVGAGPAGITAGYILAKAGAEVVIFERGEYPGAKNMFGGVLYGRILNDLMPRFWEEAPVERYVTRRIITFLSTQASLSIDFKSESFGQPPYNAFTILRSKFDRWYAKKAQEVGALLVPETTVDDVLWNQGRVIGVKVRRDSGEVYGDAVIAADGANSLLAQKAGLRSALLPEYLSIGIKEVLALPSLVIEERFGLRSNEGVENEFIGLSTQGVKGGGFLYTNRSSVSIGVVVGVSPLKNSDLKLWKLIEEFKQLSPVREIIRDGVLKEYSAHLVPTGGMRVMPKLYTDGMLVVGDAAGLVLNTGLSLEGANFAIASGIAAAETIKSARGKGDFSRSALAEYEMRLKNSFVLQDLKHHKGAPDVLSNQRLYGTYPELICQLCQRIYTVNGQPKKMLWKVTRDVIKESGCSIWQIAKDVFKAGRTL